MPSICHNDYTQEASVPGVTIQQFALGVNEYQTFCRKHGLSLDPTPDTISVFTMYVGQCQGADAVEGCLNAICKAFEHVYPDIREQCRSHSVERVIKELRMRERNVPVTW